MDLNSLLKAWEYFDKGGLLAYLILVCSFIALVVIVERLWVYHVTTLAGAGWWRELKARMKEDDLEGAGQALEGVGHPSARVLEALLDKYQAMGRCSRASLEKIANHHGRQEIRGLERSLPVLSTIANIAPLLGLAGTVLGMVRAFAQIEDLHGKVDASVLAGGIWQALLTTLFGLAVAIPTVIAYNYLAARVQGFADEIQNHAVDFIDALETIDSEENCKPEAAP